MANFIWPVSPTSQGPIQFELDNVATAVSEDTVTPANSIPLPVKAIDGSGLEVDFATEAKQDVQIVELQNIVSEVQDVEAELVTLNAVDFATEAKQDSQITLATAANASLSSIDTKVLTDTQLRATPVPVSGPLTDAQLRATAVPVSGPLTDAQLRATAVPVSAASLPLPTGAATEATLSALNDRLPGGLVPAEFDYQALTYVTSGNGIGEVETVTYKTGGAGGTTVATLTLAYDVNDRLSSVTKV